MKKLLTIMVLALALCLLCSAALAASYYNKVMTTAELNAATTLTIDGVARTITNKAELVMPTGHNTEAELTVKYAIPGADDGAVIVKVINDPHNYATPGAVITKATCSKEGSQYYSCACGAKTTKPIAKIDHTYVVDKITNDCSKGGQTQMKCAVCGAVKEDSVAPFGPAAHAFDGNNVKCYKVIEAPSCYVGSKGAVATGTYKKLCKWCGQEIDGKYYYDLTAATYAKIIGDEEYDGHTWSEKTHMPATCFERGKMIRWCLVCDVTDVEFLLEEPVKDPVFNKVTRIDGETLYCNSQVLDVQVVCANCGGKAPGHTFGGTITRTTPGDMGYKDVVFTFTYGGEDYETTAKHYYNFKADKKRGDEIAATCTSSAYQLYNCTYDTGAYHTPGVLYNDAKPALGHDFNDWKEIVAPKPEILKEGLWTRFCNRCGKYEEAHALVIPCKGEAHNWVVKEKKEATKDADGYIKYECSICKATKTEDVEYVPASAPKYEVKDAVYDGKAVSGKVTHTADTKELAAEYARVTFFYADGTFAVMVVPVEDGEFYAGATTATVHVTVQIVDNAKQITPPAESAIYGSAPATMK